MNILLISQCDKRALTETRRILDQFAERRGERTWQTPITQDGLTTLHRLLRASARKNTAVACHWIRGLDHSELLWVVGDKSRFNPQGAVPTNTTSRNVLRQDDENDWHSGEDIHLLAALAALLHDLGKASAAFQARLQGQLTERNRYRHEWVSLRLFQAFVGRDDDATWLARLAQPGAADLASWDDWRSGRFQRDGLDTQLTPPFQALAHAPLAQAVGWLIVTHHRLPLLPPPLSRAERDSAHEHRWLGQPHPEFGLHHLRDPLACMQSDWNELGRMGSRSDVSPYWHFPQGLPVALPHWQAQARRLATRLQTLVQRPDRRSGWAWLDEPYVMHLSRLALMLADHHYSSLGVQAGGAAPAAGRLSVPPGYPVWANTCTVRGHTQRNQTLDEHLLGVAAGSRRITHALPSLLAALPGLQQHKPLRQRSQHQAFRWQDKAADLAATQRIPAAEHGAFIINMASTGCGKTLANARVMNALADPARGLRCAFAMGLRTLTLQTGRAFQQRLKLGDDQLAIRVGGSASRALFNFFESRAESSGSASTQALVLEPEEEGSVEYGGDPASDTDHPLLAQALHDPAIRKLLVAPLLVCTIDHLTPATESLRGGRQIAPMLRLLTSDLVLDEPDDFDLTDLPALTRLVHWAGLLGSRVLLSSATLAPALVEGLFQAYRAGRMAYQRHRSRQPGRGDALPDIVCLWLDEYRQTNQTCATPAAFSAAHREFAQARWARLADAARQPRRVCRLVGMDRLKGISREADRLTRFAELLLEQSLALHELHAQPDPQRPDSRVSFGLIRMANIEPLVQTARTLFRLGAPQGTQVHLCVYHSQFPLFMRSAIERRLDAALDRHDESAVFRLPDIRRRLDAHPQATHQIFIVLGSPVTEVGRDHDYDWALVEPSSMRSLIQLVGRVRRHRGPMTKPQEPNVRVLNTNWRHFRQQLQPDRPVYCRPGFEDAAHRLMNAAQTQPEHHLNQLLRKTEFGVVDARPRIVCPQPLEPRSRWVDLEHERIQQAMLPPSAGAAVPPDPQHLPVREAAWWCWHQPGSEGQARRALLTGLLPQHQPFREGRKDVELCLLPDEDEPDRLLLSAVLDANTGRPSYLPGQSRHAEWPDAEVHGPGISPWADLNYATALSELAEAMSLPLRTCALRFASFSLPESEQGWHSHPALGFVKRA